MCPTDRNAPVSMLARADIVLSAFTPKDRRLGVSELSRRTGLAKSTTSRIVNDLVTLNYLERTGDQVELGLRLFELGELATRPKDLTMLAIAHMADLRSATRQTVHLAVLDGTEVVYIRILRSRTAPPLPSRVGGRMPAHATGVGKALLAFSPEQTIQKCLETGLPQVGPRTICDEGQFLTELDSIRSAGIAYESRESSPDLCCAAAPVLDTEGRAVTAISVSAQVDSVNLARIGPAVKTAALALSRNIARRPHQTHSTIVGLE